MLRLFGLVFSNLAIMAAFGLAGIAGIVHLYGDDLPDYDELVDYQPKLLSRVYANDGQVIAEYASEQRVFIPIDEVPQLVKDAFISAEDKNFYDHTGVDWVGIVKAVGRYAEAKAAGRDARLAGASTITQQVMKNFLLDNERALERKVKEAILAVRIDGALSKDQILELYLNEIFLGARSYGIVAAARNYFDKRLSELEPHEAAYLAALPKAPSLLHPVRNAEEAIGRRNYVLNQMADNGHLDRETAEAAKEEPLGTVFDTPREETRLADVPPASYFTAEVRRQVSRELGRRQLFEGGLTVRATIDARLQAIAQKALRHGLVGYDRSRGVYRGPVAVIDALAEGAEGVDWEAALDRVGVPADIPEWHAAVVLEAGAEAARIGVRGFGETMIEVNGERWISRIERDGERFPRPKRASDLWKPGDVIYVAKDDDTTEVAEIDWDMRQFPEVQGAFMAMDPETGRVLALQGGFSYDASVFNRATQALRQPGSAFKPFVYAAALDAGYTPATIVNDAPIAVRYSNGEVWEPKNSSGKSYGPTSLRKGLEYSRNLMTVRIAQTVGMDRIAKYAERFGVYEDMPHHLAYSLGAGETTLWQMVAAYGMFANGGRQVSPTVVDRIQDRNGNTIFRHDPRGCDGCQLASADPTSLPQLFDAREQIMNPATAFQIVSMLEGVVQRGTANSTVGGTDLPLAGKTGTTNDSKDAWFIGFSPKLVAGCFIGYDDPTPMGRGAYGGQLCGPVFKEFMVAALEGSDPGDFAPPDDSGLVTVKIDRNTGERLPDDARGPNVLVEVFEAGNEPTLYAAASRIEDDRSLFGDAWAESASGALPYSLDESPSYGGGGGNGGSGSSGGGRSSPSMTPSIGLGTGGLY